MIAKVSSLAEFRVVVEASRPRFYRFLLASTNSLDRPMNWIIPRLYRKLFGGIWSARPTSGLANEDCFYSSRQNSFHRLK